MHPAASLPPAITHLSPRCHPSVPSQVLWTCHPFILQFPFLHRIYHRGGDGSCFPLSLPPNIQMASLLVYSHSILKTTSFLLFYVLYSGSSYLVLIVAVKMLWPQVTENSVQNGLYNKEMYYLIYKKFYIWAVLGLIEFSISSQTSFFQFSDVLHKPHPHSPQVRVEGPTPQQEMSQQLFHLQKATVLRNHFQPLSGQNCICPCSNHYRKRSSRTNQFRPLTISFPSGTHLI